MKASYLLDENLSLVWRPLLLKLDPDLVVLRIGDPGAPPLGSLDPEILLWCESRDYVLVTGNRSSMPGHLVDHLAAGRHIPGIFQLPETYQFVQMASELVLIANTMLPREFEDQQRYLPLSY